jgi:hypothetical protein
MFFTEGVVTSVQFAARMQTINTSFSKIWCIIYNTSVYGYIVQ